ncbi:MAG: hypothetical protein ACP5NF_11195 [Thermoanaerobaculum sp.]
MSCEEVQGLLEEGVLTPEGRTHVASCPVCHAHAALLAQLYRLEVPPAPKAGPWVRGLPHPSWLWRKPATYLPLAAGSVTLGCGLVLGASPAGLPGTGELSLLARAFWEVSGMAVGEGLRVVARALATAWGPWVGGAALVLAASGLALLYWVKGQVRA